MASGTPFDPYHKWLGIPPEEQPPHHYRLLAIQLFEADADVIHSAADQRMAHLRTFQSGAYSETSQKLLNELAAARVCLLKPDRKAAYDAELKTRLAPPPAPPQSVNVPLMDLPSARAAPPHTIGLPPAYASPPSPWIRQTPPLAVPISRPHAQVAIPVQPGSIGNAVAEEPEDTAVEVASGLLFRRSRRQKTDGLPVMLAMITILLLVSLVTAVWMKQQLKKPPLETAAMPKPVARTITPPPSPAAAVEPKAKPTPRPPAVPEPKVPQPSESPAKPAPARRLPSVIDDADVRGFTQHGDRWQKRTGNSRAFRGSLASHPADDGSAATEWSFDGLEQGKRYVILSTWTADAANSRQARYGIRDGQLGMQFIPVDQSIAPRTDREFDGHPFQKLATVSLHSDLLTVRLATCGDGGVSADAVLLMEAPARTVVAARPRPTQQDSAQSQPVPSRPNDPTPPETAPKPVEPESIAAKEPEPAPSADSQANARKLVREVFAADFAAADSPSQNLALAETLLAQAAKSKDAAERYVLTDEAFHQAVASGNVTRALAILREQAEHFEIDLGEAECQAVEDAANVLTTNDARIGFASAVLDAADRAADEDRFSAAARMLKSALDAAKKASDGLLVKSIVARGKVIAEQEQEYAAVLAAKEALATNPDDAAAHLIVGRHECFVRQNWETGLPHLAKGADAELAGIAMSDVQQPKEANERVALADRWAELGLKAEGEPKLTVLERADHWYREALPDATGLLETKINKRLEEIASALKSQEIASASDNGTSQVRALSKKLRSALKAKQVSTTAMVGTRNPRNLFREFSASGTPLTGFHFAVEQGDHVCSVQPLYLGTRKAVNGDIHGDPSRGSVGKVEAPKGYAVGGLKVYGEGMVRGFEVIFMRITSSGLDPNDRQLSSPVGNIEDDDSESQTLGGDGRPVIGIFGAVRPRGSLEGLGLIQTAQ